MVSLDDVRLALIISIHIVTEPKTQAVAGETETILLPLTSMGRALVVETVVPG